MHSRVLVMITALVAASACSDRNIRVRTVSEYNETIPIGGIHVQLDDQPWAVTDDAGEVVLEPTEEGTHTVRVFQQTVYDPGVTERRVVSDDVWQFAEVEPGEFVVLVDGSEFDQQPCTLEGTTSGAEGAASVTIRLANSGSGSAMDGAFEIMTEATPDPVAVFGLAVFDAGSPDERFRYGWAAVDIKRSGDTCGASGITLELAPVPATHLHGRIRLPAEYNQQDFGVEVGVQVAEGDQRVFFDLESNYGDGPELTFDTYVPAIGTPFVGGGSKRACTEGRAEFIDDCAPRVALRLDVEDPSQELVIDLPAPRTITAPGSEVAIGTEFLWDAGPTEGTYSLQGQCSYRVEGYRHGINFRGLETTAPQVTLFDAPGLVLEAGMECAMTASFTPDTWTGWLSAQSQTRLVTGAP
ncbi:MAG: hypothetical protein KC933_34250 [Myxococcales bacterium]|nr:hypothetical protein [Myxococcales bacterium]